VICVAAIHLELSDIKV